MNIRTFNCSELFIATITDEGQCCSFNIMPEAVMFKNAAVHVCIPCVKACSLLLIDGSSMPFALDVTVAFHYSILSLLGKQLSLKNLSQQLCLLCFAFHFKCLDVLIFYEDLAAT